MKRLLSLLIALFLFAAIVSAQETKTVNGKEYAIQTGERGGRFIIIETGEKIYLPKYSAPVLTNDTIADYKGKKYPVHTGSRGGKFIITEEGSKIYIPKQ